VALLISGLMMGLHRILKQVLQPITHWILKEGDIVKLVSGLCGLHLAHSAQNVLETWKLTNFTDILQQGFDRACERLTWMGQTDTARLREIADSLLDLNSFVSREEPWANRKLFLQSIEQLYEMNTPDIIRGTAAGILASHNIWTPSKVKTVLKGICNQAYLSAGSLGDFLSGFLPVARHELIQNNDLINQMTETICSWDETTFLNALPALRLAFTHLTPRETREFAGAVQTTAGTGMSLQLTPVKWRLEDLQLMEQLRKEVHAELAAWGIRFSSEEVEDR
jgi:hypothetical protein